MAQSPLGTSRHIAVTQQFGRFWRILLKKSAGVTWPIDHWNGFAPAARKHDADAFSFQSGFFRLLAASRQGSV